MPGRGLCCRLPILIAAVLCALPLCAENPGLTIAQKEEFLRKAKILRTRNLSEGVTNSRRATLSDGQITHDAHIQHIDDSKATFTSMSVTELNFRDTYKANIAAYRLAKMLGLQDMVPPSVERQVGGRPAAVTWWVDDVLMTEKQRRFRKVEPPDVERWNKQMHIVRIFDQLIYNMDRNLGNLVITKSWDIWMIDHTRAFRLYKSLKTAEDLQQCDRHLLEFLRALEEKTLMVALQPYLTRSEIRALLARRDLIVNFFDQAVAEKGEREVLYDFLGAR